MDNKDFSNKQTTISELIQTWDSRKELLTNLFRKRDKASVGKPMEESITAFLSFLYAVNDKHPKNKEELNKELDSLQYKPINVKERLEFIMKKPHQYHSFIQLTELFHELEKLNAKKQIIKQKK